MSGNTLRKLFPVALLVAAIVLIYSTSTDSPDPSGPDPAPLPLPSIGMIDEARINAADSEPGNWLAYGRTYEEQRFSPLEQINRESISRLGLAWAFDMRSTRALEATPIVVDNMMFVSSAWSKVHALNATTGEEIWFYDPKVPGAWARKACCDVVNRGVAVYQGRVYVASLDGRLIALDAASGKLVWEVDTLIDRARDYTITGAPRVANGKVYIGNGGAEYGVRGYVSAFDAATGELVWRFYTVPGDPSLPFEHPEMELAAKTWKGGEWWTIGGGGTVWNSIVYDPEFNHLYIGVGNGAPWTRVIRSPGGGDNLFLSSIVALDADTGAMQWYYQTTPGDNWDYTAVQDMVLADLEVDGVDRKVLMQAPKNGFFYVLDRSDGELLRAHPYTAVTWASHVDMDSGRPVETPGQDYVERPQWVLPGPLGGHNWQAMSFDEDKGLMYIPTQEAPFPFAVADEWRSTGKLEYTPGTWNPGVELARLGEVSDEAGESPPTQGALKAFDPLTGETRWSVAQAHYWNGGVLATRGGLVFQGDNEGMLHAFDADNGDPLWSFNAYTAFLAPPISYQIDGTQYLAILAGTGGGALFTGEVEGMASAEYGNAGKLLVFKLDGNATMALPQRTDQSIPELEPSTASAAQIRRGTMLYGEYCVMCHGLEVRSLGSIPDLRKMTSDRRDQFEEIVLGGMLATLGMDSFADVLNEQNVSDIKAYITQQAIEDRAEAQSIEIIGQ
ncbi:MAG: PQQ-dependent dehydrogenase, methanol/ethanol family [Halioglobus sp.]